MTFTELQNLVQQQALDIKALQEEVERMNNLKPEGTKFSGRTVINEEVQYNQKVYRANGTLVTQINP